MSTEAVAALSAPYARRVGKMAFLISSFGNQKGKETAAEMLLHMMERQQPQTVTVQGKED